MSKVDFPSNSQNVVGKKSKPKKVDPVVTGKVKRKKQTLGGRFKSLIFSEDSDSVTSYILYEIIIPSAKDLLYDVITGGAKVSLFGERSGTHASKRSSSGQTSYSKYYYSSARSNDKPSKPPASARNRHSFDDIIVETRAEAEEVLSHMTDLIDIYGIASVSDLYALLNIDSSYTDNKYGWDNIGGFGKSQVRDGYKLIFPKPKVIE